MKVTRLTIPLHSCHGVVAKAQPKKPTTLKKAGLPVSWYYTMFLNPLPPKMLEELKKKDLVIVPELNYQGQFSNILRSMGVKAESITQYTGLPFKARTLVAKITEMTNANLKEATRA